MVIHRSRKLLGIFSVIIDAHVHLYPDQGGHQTGRPLNQQLALMQESIGEFWGRMVTSHQDRKYIPGPNEDVGFRVVDYGRWAWRKHGENCWLQRGSTLIKKMEHTPQQLIAAMDAAGVDIGVVQTDIEYLDLERGRTSYFESTINSYSQRLLVTIALDFSLSHDDAHLDLELSQLEQCIAKGFRGVYLSGVGLPEPLDDPRCNNLWRTISQLKTPVYVQTGFCTKSRYLEQLRGLLNVLERYSDLTIIESHFGGNLLHPKHPGYTDILKDLAPLMSTRQFYLELGYVLGYEDERYWGNDAHYPFPAHNNLVRQLYDIWGSTHLVWGSDIPWCYRVCTYQQVLDLIKENTSYMSAQERQSVLGGNMAQLFHLTAA